MGLGQQGGEDWTRWGCSSPTPARGKDGSCGLREHRRAQGQDTWVVVLSFPLTGCGTCDEPSLTLAAFQFPHLSNDGLEIDDL